MKSGDARVDGRADRPSLSGGDREPDDFDMGDGVPWWEVVNGQLVRRIKPVEGPTMPLRDLIGDAIL